MSDSDDDVVIIDSSLPSTSVSSGGHGGPAEMGESKDGSDDMIVDDAREVVPLPSSRACPPKSASPPRTTLPVDVFCRKLEGNIRALPPLRAHADTQTNLDFCGGAAARDSAASLHRNFLEMEVALGIRMSAKTSAASSAVGNVVRQFVDSWRDATGKWKRLRSQDETRDDTDIEDVKHVKRESDNEVDVWQRLPDSSSVRPSETPAWAVGLESAFESCREVLESPNYTVAVGQQKQSSFFRAPVTPPVATKTHLASPQVQRTPSAPVSVAPVVARDSKGDFLREAEIICAREGTKSLFPIYTELHALRHMRAEREQQAALTVEKQLEWEQRRLTVMLSECDAQLDMLDINFMDSCKTGLVPLEVLQQRMEALNSIRRQLESHTSAALPLTAQSVEATTKCERAAAGSATTAARPMGLAGDAFLRCMAEERRVWDNKMEVLQARLDEQAKRTAELQACYVQANMQLQASLDKDNYVNKEVLNAAKAQQQSDMQVLVEQLGWILINNTSDVLSLRHPGTGNTLHVNRTYSTINGETCENIPKALAAYILKHGDPTAQAGTPAAPTSVSSSAAVTQSAFSEDQSGSQSVPSPLPPPQAPYPGSGAESIEKVLSPDVKQATEETPSALTADTLARAASAKIGAISARSSRQSSLPPGADVTTTKDPPVQLDSTSIHVGLAEEAPQSLISSGSAPASMEERVSRKEDSQEAYGSVAASSVDLREDDSVGDDVVMNDEEGGNAYGEDEDGDGGGNYAEGDLPSFSNTQAEENSGNASTLNVTGGRSSAGVESSDEPVARVQPSLYESYFSNSPLWENAD
ncbi:hypothetical protein JKF63_04318 [Porcisia hertigi]|uniref:Uncharacterized protein n=1 Tax=Porcisia hertigi TaxID=2761500 RepID=A0A836L7Q7_9TRYP|nr:hypothetical protein JKF63_04318 [Porcisia hertigi]